MRVLFVIKQIDNEPHGIMYLSSHLKRAGHEVRLVVTSYQDPLAVAAEFRPDILGYTVYTGTQHYYLDLNRKLKESTGAFSIFGGPHPTFFPEMVEVPGVDGICVGEGAQATLELVAALERGEPYHEIQNWWFKIDGRVYQNPVRPLFDNLDEEPLADRELLYEAHPPSRDNKIKPFISGRGCPFDCSFCFNHAYGELYKGKGKRARQRSVDNVMAEILEVKGKYPLEFITFMDDTFILSKSWLKEFGEKYRRLVGLPFWCQVRPNLVNEEIIGILADAGCVSLSMGVEAGNDYFRNMILKRNLSREQMIGASKVIRDAGLKLSTNNMLGLPGGSLEIDMETLMLNIECKPSYANVFLLQPYPRTELGDYAMKEGLMEGSFDDITESVANTSVIKFKSKAEKRATENLQKLFAVTVEFPFLLPLVKVLVKLPSNPLYWFVYKAWKGYTLKYRLMPHKLSFKEYVGTALRYMQIKSQ